MKKILLLLAAMLVASAALAQKSMIGITFSYQYKGNELYYKVTSDPSSGNPGTVAVTSCVQSANLKGTVSIPDEVKHKGKKYKVTSLEKNAICRDHNITKIEITGQIKNIPSGAFSYLPELTTVYCEQGVETCSTTAFVNCPKLKTVSVSSSFDKSHFDNMKFEGCPKAKVVRR